MHNKPPKKYYFIETFIKSNIDKLDKNTAIIFRNYSEKIKKSEILNLKNYCKNKGLKCFLSNNVKLSIKLNFDGVYLPSFNKNIRHLNYKLKSNFLIIGSAHNIKEIKIKELQKASIIFISSIFKKNKNFLGINKFRNISKHSTKKIIALGGISQRNYKLLKLTNCYGFAGISYFKKKAPKKGPF
jgi:thiamine-phosphate pyrophosphorylase